MPAADLEFQASELVGGAAMTGNLIAAQLHGVSGTDPVIFLLVPPVLGLVAMAACFEPARSALGASPAAVLRSD